MSNIEIKQNHGLYGVYIRRGALLTHYRSGVHELPGIDSEGAEISSAESKREQTLAAAILKMTGVQVTAFSHWHGFTGRGGEWCYVTLERFPDSDVIEKRGLDGFQWLPLEGWRERNDVSPGIRDVLEKVSEQAGNIYTPARTITGINTLAHMATGELLHGHEGPMQEAWKLYIEPLGLLNHKGSLVVYDLGLGAGTLVLACREAWLQNPELTSLHIVSFDLEKLGIDTMLEYLNDYSYALPHTDFLMGMKQGNKWQEVHADGRTFSWEFQEGDFRQTMLQEQKYKANRIFFDFFSMKSHPDLWKLDVMEALYRNSSEDVLLATYASATSIRANLLAAGFYVGFGIPSGKKSRTTMAARRRDMLQDLLAKEWVTTFLRSHLPFVTGEAEDTCQVIRERVCAHPQFQELRSESC